MEVLERVRVREGERKVLTTGEYVFMKDDKIVGKVTIDKHPTYVRRIEGVRVFRIVKNDLTSDYESGSIQV